MRCRTLVHFLSPRVKLRLEVCPRRHNPTSLRRRTRHLHLVFVLLPVFLLSAQRLNTPPISQKKKKKMMMTATNLKEKSFEGRLAPSSRIRSATKRLFPTHLALIFQNMLVLTHRFHYSYFSVHAYFDAVAPRKRFENTSRAPPPPPFACRRSFARRRAHPV